ncbi:MULTISPECIES: hypothetical protein [Corynebacterium]|uniref:hypothetical protein n=2 Tax=Corynebacteriaceae TaxID=1653 RepID=UPI00124E45B4|nr:MULTISPECIES: hypothetical protein [Corynebacterium]
MKKMLSYAALAVAAVGLAACGDSGETTTDTVTETATVNGETSQVETVTETESAAPATRTPVGGTAPCEIRAYSNNAEDDLLDDDVVRAGVDKPRVTQLVQDQCGSATFDDDHWTYRDGAIEVEVLEDGTVDEIDVDD